MRNLVVLIGAIGLAGCSSLTPTNDPVYLRITDLEARLLRIERVLENESLIALAQDISSLRTELQSLLGEVETLAFELENQGERQRDLYVDLDQRLSQLEAAQTRIVNLPQGSAAGQLGGAVNDEQAYNAAYDRLLQQDWAGAEAEFRRFLAAYPASALAGNAQYWLGESRYARLDFSGAAEEFQRVLDNYPQSIKVPDAWLKLGFSQHELGNRDQARMALTRVIREFPGTSAAASADERLRQISAEGG